MANYDLGTATGTIEIKYSDKGTKRAKDDLEGVGTSAKKAGISGDQMAKGLAATGAVIAGGLAVAVNSAATFEQRLSAIKAVSGSTAAEMEKVRAKALQIGKDTAFSATEAAQAMEELSKAGVSTSDILNGAADATVALAAAGEIDLPKAAEISSNAMNQFNLSAKDLPRVADLIAGAANASAIDVKEFGFSLSQAGAVAHLAGLSFDDTAVAIAEMGNAGIKGSDAGTSLKTFLSNLQPTTKKQIDLFKELNLLTKDGSNAFFDQAGKLKSLKDIQQILNTSLKGMTQQQKQATLETLFGSDAIRAAAVLSDEGAAGYTKMATAMGKVKAADVAATKMDNLKGSVEQLKGSAETLAIQLGSILLPTIRDIVDQANALVGWFSSLSPQTQEIAVKTAAAAAAFLLFGAGIIKAVEFVQKFAAAIKLIAGVARLGPLFSALATGVKTAALAFRALTLAMVTNPIGLIIIAVIALVAAIVLLWKNSETFRNIVKAVWAAVKAAIGAVVDWFMNVIVPSFMQAVNDVIKFFTYLWNGIVRVWNLIKAAVGAAVKFIFNLLKTYVNLYIGAWKLAWNVILTVIKAVWTAITTVIRTYVNLIRTVITTALNVIRTVVSAVFNAIRAVVTAVWNASLAVTRSVWNRITSTIRGAINAALAVVRSIRGAVIGALSGAGSWLINAGKNIIRGLLNGISSMIGQVRSKLSELTGLIPDWKGPKERDEILLEQNGQLIMEGLLRGISSQVGPLQRLLQGITTDIPTSFVDPRLAVGSDAMRRAIDSAAAPIASTPVTVNNYNPVAEPSSVTTTKSMTRLAQLGVLG